MKLGEWVHCVCGCGYTGRIVEQGTKEDGTDECSVKNSDIVRVYTKRSLREGAVCEVCAGDKLANVLVTYTHPAFKGQVFEDTLCWSCFAVSGLAKHGVKIESVKPLVDGQEGDIAASKYE